MGCDCIKKEVNPEFELDAQRIKSICKTKQLKASW